MKISAKVGASTRLYVKKFHKSQRDPNPSRRVNPGLEKGYPVRRVDPGWLLRSCKYLLQVDRRRVYPLRWVEVTRARVKGTLVGRHPADYSNAGVAGGYGYICFYLSTLLRRGLCYEFKLLSF